MEATAPGKGKKAAPPPPPSSPERTSEDEQMERFYALVANIRAMRAMFKAGSSCVDVNEGQQCKKRPREDQRPPWRPAFEMEDFEYKKGRSGVKAAAAEEEGEVVEGKAVAVAVVTAQLMPDKIN